jgi:hypothetical protein
MARHNLTYKEAAALLHITPFRAYMYRAGTFVYNDERETRILELMAERSRYHSESFTWAGPDHSQMK